MTKERKKEAGAMQGCRRGSLTPSYINSYDQYNINDGRLRRFGGSLYCCLLLVFDVSNCHPASPSSPASQCKCAHDNPYNNRQMSKSPKSNLTTALLMKLYTLTVSIPFSALVPSPCVLDLRPVRMLLHSAVFPLSLT